MPRYDAKAQEFVFGFYSRGWPPAKALAEIRKVYPGFAEKTWRTWIKEFGWEERRAIADAKLRAFDVLAKSAHVELLLDLERVRKALSSELDASPLDPQKVYAFIGVCRELKNVVELNADKQDPQRVAMEVLKLAIEAMLAELRTVPGLQPLLKKNANRIGAIVEKTAASFGRS